MKGIELRQFPKTRTADSRTKQNKQTLSYIFRYFDQLIDNTD